MATHTMRPRTSILTKYWNFAGAILFIVLGSAVIALPQCRSTEHLLLGLLQAAEQEKTQLNLSPEINSQMIAQSIESLVGIGPSEDVPNRLLATPAAKRVLNRAFELHRDEGTQAMLLHHLLEALRAEQECVAAHLLIELSDASAPVDLPPA